MIRATSFFLCAGLVFACGPFPGEPEEPDADVLTPEDTPKAGPEPAGHSNKSAEDMTDRPARGLDGSTHTAAGSGGSTNQNQLGGAVTSGGGAPPK